MGLVRDIQVEVSGKKLEIKVQGSTDTSRPVERTKAGRKRREGGREEEKKEGRKVGRRKGDGPVPAHHTWLTSLLDHSPQPL